MALKREVASLDEIPEALRSAYVEKDGKFVLDLDGEDGLKGALEKERKARGDIERQLKDIKKALGDADPAKAREAIAQLAALEEKAALGEVPAALLPKIEEMVAKRIERMKTDHEGRVRSLEEANGKLNGRLEELLIDGAIRTAAAKAGVRATAIEDAVLYGKTVWKLKDGHPVAVKPDGEPAFGKDGKPITVEEWLTDRTKDRAHWFEPSNGGGATPSTTRGTSGAVVLSSEDAKDRAKYVRARQEAQKAGVELVIQ
jgi:hypothetical protein